MYRTDDIDPMDSTTYHERRRAIKRAVDQCAHITLTDLMDELDYSYTYVADVLRGAPGKVSGPCLEDVEAALKRRGVTVATDTTPSHG